MSEHEPEDRDDQAATETGDTREQNVEIPSHDEEFARLKADNARLEETLLRAKADLMNIRKRQLKDLDEARRRTVEGLATELLPVLDTFRYALDACDKGEETDTKTVIEGIRMVQTLLSGTLERHGLAEMEVADTAFDPARHEAVGVEPQDDVDDGMVVRVMQAGYTLGERVLRPAKVVVSGDPAQGGDDASPDNA